jgi:hypothetical protein
MAPFERVALHEVVERTRCPVSAPLAGQSGLAAYMLARVEDLGEALQTQVAVPRLGKADVLLVQPHQMHLAVADDVAAPLLDGNIIVAPVLCEAPDYVKRSYTTWLRRSVHGARVFALLNIVRDSSRTDIRSARGDYGPVIEEGAIAFRLRGQL